MKKQLRYILLGLLAALTLAVYIAGLLASAKSRYKTTCQGLRVEVADSAKLSFVNEEDVKGFLGSYGEYIGQRIDSVNLKRIEKILAEKSAILRADAYMTDDGFLNVILTQREPVVRFHSNGNGYYADESGFIFPLQKSYSSRVPIVDGYIPMKISRGFKGEPATDKEKQWLSSLLGLLDYIGSNKIWSGNFSQITVLQGGDLVLVPREGKERFIFGNLSGVERKFARMKEYYEFIAPSKEEGYYSSVDLLYEGQIVCRK